MLYMILQALTRFSTRPFLEPIEKLWITFQLLTALKKCHENSVCHGDIKSENILVTSWNWAYLSDFASFKPIFLPEDDPSQFSFFFDTSLRRSCYVAPERFLAAGEQKQGELTHAMDIFSLGCVIAELFLEGTHIFSLAQLFKYRKREYVPDLSEIENKNVRELVTSMISLDPKDRLTAEQYLHDWKHKLFPDYYYDFLHDFIGAMSTRNHFTSNNNILDPQSFLDQRINFIYEHFDKVVKYIGFGQYESDLKEVIPSNVNEDIDTILVDLPGWRHVVTSKNSHNAAMDDGALIVLSLITSSLRNVSRASIKLKGLDLMLALSQMINDEAKLDRCLPFFLSLLDDESDIVQAAAVRSMTQLLTLVTVITPLNGALFPEYIFQRLDSINSKSSVLVRATYASCLSSLAQSASRFLEMGQILKTAGMLESFDPETENGTRIETISFDNYRQGLISLFRNHTSALLTDSSTAVRKAFLKSITPLCIFFGRQQTNDVILTHLITYLNDPDSSLRRQFFDCIIGLGPFIGPTSLEQYVQPLMLQALNDPEEFVIAKAFEAFASFAQLGLLKKSDNWNILKVAVRYTMHPNAWIRNNVFGLLTASISWMSPAELHCTLYPILKPFLDCEIKDFTTANLVRSFKKPLRRPVFREALIWVSRAKKSIFWKLPATGKDGSVEAEINLVAPTSVDHIPKSSEDTQYLDHMYHSGVTVEDIWKISVLRDHIYRVARLSYRLQSMPDTQELSAKFFVSSLGLTPETVYLNNSQYALESQMDQLALGNLDDIRENQDNEPSAKSDPVKLNHSLSQSILDGTSPRLAEIQLGTKGATFGQPSATTATDTTEVYGQMDRPYSPQFTQSRQNKPTITPESTTYDSDPYISKMVKAAYVNLPTTEPVDFGSQIVPVNFAEHLHNPTSSSRKSNWKPTGVLASQFTEHKDAVNKIAISPDHNFFLTCSDDGYIKLWDCPRLEKNVINKSAQTFHCGDTKAKFICFIENTYTFACSCTDGSIKIIRVDVTLDANNIPSKYKKMHVVRNYQLPEGTYAVWMEHVKTSDGSVLIVATTNSKLIGIELNSMQEKFILEQPYNHGIPTCFVVDSRRTCLLLGTSTGVLNLWDLRFNILVKTWTFEDPAPIKRLSLRPKEIGFSVVVVGGTSKCEISLWRINEFKCTEVYHAGNRVDPTKVYQIIKFEESTYKKTQQQGKNKRSKREADEPAISEKEPELLCVAVGIDSPREGEGLQHVHVLTGGTDRKIRFWDLQSMEASSIVSGLATDTDAASVGLFKTYNNGVKVIGERTTTAAAAGSSRAKPVAANGARGAAPSVRYSRSSRTAIIASEQQDMARNHQASIVDIAILHKPYQMIISADRAGVIKVFI